MNQPTSIHRCAQAATGALCLSFLLPISATSQESAPAVLESTVVEATPAPKPAPAPRRTPAPRPAAPAPAPAPVVIDDSINLVSPVATESFSATKLNTPLIKTPQSISVITREELDMRGARNVNDALSYSAGVLTERNGIDTRADDISVRGFNNNTLNSSNNYLDGLRMPTGGTFGASALDAFGFESVEVVKGPASVLFGQIAPGGLVNRTSKRPLDYSRNEIGVEYFNYGSNSNAGRITFDTTGPIGGTSDYYYDGGGKSGKGGKQLVEGRSPASYRFAGFYQDGGTQYDHIDLERIYLAPSVTFHLGEDTDLTLYSIYQRDTGGFGFQFLPTSITGLSLRPPLAALNPMSPNGLLDPHSFLGEPAFDQFDRTQFLVGYELDHRFNDVWSISHNFRYSRLETDYQAVIANFFAPNRGLSPNGRTVARRSTEGFSYTDAIQFDTRLVAEFSTGAADHTALLGFDYLKMDTEHERWDRRAVGVGPGRLPGIDAYNPAYSGATFLGIPFNSWADNGIIESEQIGLYAQDQIEIGNWIASLGGRYDWSDTFTSQVGNLPGPAGATTTKLNPPGVLQRSDTSAEAFTGRAGLLYLSESGLAPYASYATSFEPTSGTAFGGAPFDPTTGEQFEIGVKYEPKSFKGLFTASYFDLTQQNVLTPDPANPGFQVQTGEIAVDGFEFEARAQLAEGLYAIGALTFLDAEISKSNVAAERGKEWQNVPDYTASAWLDYTFPEGPLHGLGVGVGVRHVNERFGDNANLIDLPSYTLVDAAIRYDLGALSPDFEGAKLSLSATNLADELYVATATGPISSWYGSARVVTLKMTYEW
ncbi:MAG TPA: TonB-dependent siderophore receptor [Bacteroidia bacterium]|nr:TonB-dependent siderophore receptor [Bacteroidia bacterium]